MPFNSNDIESDSTVYLHVYTQIGFNEYYIRLSVKPQALPCSVPLLAAQVSAPLWFLVR